MLEHLLRDISLMFCLKNKLNSAAFFSKYNLTVNHLKNHSHIIHTIYYQKKCIPNKHIFYTFDILLHLQTLRNKEKMHIMALKLYTYILI